MKERIKKWLTDQVEASKTAWTIIVIIAGLLGYQANLVPLEKGVNSQQTIEKRLANVETQLKVDTHVNPDLTKNLQELKNKVEKDLAELQKALDEAKKPTSSGKGYIIPAPKVPE